MRRMVGTILMALSLCLAGLGGLVITSGTVGAASASSAAVPGAPTHLIGISRYRSVRISWTAPTNHGSSAINRYEVIELSGSSTCSTGPTARTCVVPNLVTGSTHTFKVRAFNAVGAGPFSSGIPVRVGRPMPPANLAGTPGDGSVLASWTPVTGQQVTSYTVTASPGGRTCTAEAPADSCTVTGLTNGTHYTLTATATNLYGAGGPSVASSPVTPGVVPSAPTAVTAGGEVVAGSPSVWVNFTAPASPGSSPITGYTVVVDDTTTSTVTDDPAPLAAATVGMTPGTGYTVSGLNGADSYTFSVYATNTVGNSSPSAPIGPTPPGPTSISASSNGDGTADVSWTPSTVTFGTTITGFSLSTLDLSSFTVGPTGTAGPSATSTTLTGLTIGDLYDVCVRADNTFGTGESEICTEFTETGAVPSAPTAVTAGGEVVAGSPSVVVSFTAPASPGSSPITGYTVVVDDTTTSTVTDDPAPLAAATVGMTPGTGYTVSGLNGADSYTFSVYATNAVGNSSPSPPTGPTPPGPTSIAASSNHDGTANVSWTPSTVTFGTTITGFSLSSFNFTSFTVGPSGTAGPSATSTTLSGLTTGDVYDVCVRADNTFGTGQSETCTEFSE